MARNALPRGEYPRPQFVRDRWLSLNGPWAFDLDGGNNGQGRGWHEKPRLGRTILVPFCPESRLSGIAETGFMPCVWYARTFTVPRAWAGQRLLLHLGAVDYEATVWVNGRCVGAHRGGYTPFTCEITDALRGPTNQLVVRAVDDCRTGLQAVGKQSARYASFGCCYTRTTGIWQSVWIEPVGPSYLAGVRMVGDCAGGRIALEARIDRPDDGLTLELTARAGADVVAQATVHADAPVAAAVLDLDVVRLWDLDDPFLYDLELVLRNGRGVVDRVSSYFGLRKISLSFPAILLNGRPVFQRLVLDQGFYPAGLYTAPRERDLVNDIRAAQRLGFNGARLHQKVFEPRFLHHADRLGYLVWGEFADWGVDRNASGEPMRRLMAEWTEAVQRDLNHPCIVGWCPMNETRGWKDPRALIDVYRLTKALDPTRPVIDSSGYDHYATDVYDCHHYEQDPAKFAALFNDFLGEGPPFQNSKDYPAWAGQPYFCSEYGGIWWNPRRRGDAKAWGYGDRPRSREEFLTRYRRLTDALLDHPRMCGLCYTQLTDVEQEVNGLMTYGRTMKFDPATIAAINRRKAAIER